MTDATIRGKHLHVDCASGAAGDMMLGALLDLGVPVEVVGAALDAIGAGRARLKVTKVTKHGIAATDLKVSTDGELAGAHRHTHVVAQGAGDHDAPDHDHADPHSHDRPDHRARPRRDTMQSPAFSHALDLDHAHAHGHDSGHDHAGVHVHEHVDDHAGDHDHVHVDDHADVHDHAGDRVHAHYHYADIRARIESAALTPGTKRIALDIFDRIARAEATIHRTDVASVSFHEVGAIDSVVDVVGTAAALDWLAPASVSCTGVAMGHGTLHCAHGVLPVPAPAALEVLREAGGVMTDGGVSRELCTPTGAAILAASVTHWAPAPAGTPLAIGWGAGDADLADRANVLRAVVVAPVAAVAEVVWQIDANLDDMSPELCGPAAEAVFAAGALDVWWTAITMKKGRPALTLSALAETGTRDLVIAAILRETTTIGVRYAPRERTVLARRIVVVETRFGAIPLKVAGEGDAVNVAPEYEACAAAARTHGVPVKLVFAAALAAYDGAR